MNVKQNSVHNKNESTMVNDPRYFKDSFIDIPLLEQT